MPRRAFRGQPADIGASGASRLAGIIGRYRRESVGLVVAAAAALVIFVNALFLQPGPHPAPILGAKTNASKSRLAEPAGSVALPHPRPNVPAQHPEAAARTRAQTVAEIQRALSQRGFYDDAIDGVWGAKTDAAAREFATINGLKIDVGVTSEMLRAISATPIRTAVTNAATAPAPANDPIARLAGPSKRVLAIQHALADFGYGQIKPTGMPDAQTQAAIANFERDRGMPVTGQVSDRLARALSTMTGRPLE